MTPSPTTPEIPDGIRGLRDRFLGDTLRYAPAVLVPAAVSVVGVVIFTRLLDTDAYGLYSVAIAAVTILNVVCAGWIQQSVLRYLPEYAAEGRGGEVVGYTIGLNTTICIALTVVFGAGRVFAPGLLGQYAGLWLSAGALLIAEMSFTAFGGVLQAQLRSQRLASFRIIGATIRFAGALGFLMWFDRDIHWLLWGAALGRGVVTLILLLMLMRENDHWILPRLDGAVVRRFASYGVPMVGWSLGSQVLGLSDRFVISAFHGSGPVGVYSANYNLVTMGFGLLSMPLLMAAHPLIVMAWKRDGSANISAVITSFSRPYVIAVVPALAVLTVCSGDVAQMLLGDAFRGGSGIIPVLVAGSFAWGFAMYGHKGLELSERTLVMFVLVAVTAVANIALNLVFVPRFGYTAAAYTTLASYLLYPVLVYWISRRYVPWGIPWKTVAITSACGVAAGVVGHLVRNAITGQPVVVVVAVTTAVTLTVFAGMFALWSRKHPSGAAK